MQSCFKLLVAVAIVALAASPALAIVGPTSTLYIMNYGEFGSNTGLDLVQGVTTSSHNTNLPLDINIAVYSDVRTMGYGDTDQGARFEAGPVRHLDLQHHLGRKTAQCARRLLDDLNDPLLFADVALEYLGQHVGIVSLHQHQHRRAIARGKLAHGYKLAEQFHRSHRIGNEVLELAPRATMDLVHAADRDLERMA